jgi:glycosyltransferase involved in cell wall biosynthesis
MWAQRHIARLARKCGLRDPLLWLNPNDAGHLIGRLSVGERGVVYDITDDWELAAPDAATRQSIAARDRRLCRRADLTVVCSQALFESRQTAARRLLLLPNGVEAEHYAEASTYDADKRKHCAWPGRVFGYTGTLHPERIDLDLLISLARAFPDDSVVLVGPDAWKDDTLKSAAREVPNLHVVEPVPYAELAQAMACFDVCIVPHRQTPFIESLNPIKLWEYLAVGKPIVSSNVAGFRDYPTLCRVASSHEEFLAACRDALEEAAQGPSTQSALARRAEAAQHSWEARLDTLLEALRASRLLDSTSSTSVGGPVP